MPMTGQQILDRAWIKAQDNGDGGPVRWTAPEGLMWLNDGRREIANIDSSAYTRSQVRPLVPNSTRQTLAGLGITDGVRVRDVPCNYAANLTTPGRAITQKERKHYDECYPMWRSEVGNAVRSVMIEEAEPDVFYVSPAVMSGAVQVVYAAIPPELTSLGQPIGLSDMYANALQFFVLSNFYLKDASFTASPAKANFFLQLFIQSLGAKQTGNLKAVADAVISSNKRGPAS